MATTRAGLKVHKKLEAKKLVIEALSEFPGRYEALVFVNKIEVGKIDFIQSGTAVFEISIEDLFVGPAEIEFQVYKLWSPSIYLNIDDNRQLGIGLKRVYFSI